VPEFDAELYLRLLGEQELASGVDLPHAEVNGRAGLSAAAAAFVATGVIEPEPAAAITGDYRTADSLRTGRQQHFWNRAWSPSSDPTVALEPRRVHALNTTIALDKGRRLLVHSLTRAGDSAWMQGEMFSETPFVHGGGPGGGPPALSIATPAGRNFPLSFQGGWGDHHAHGRFTVPDGALDGDTTWLEIEGTRVTLEAPVPAPSVVVESFDSERLAVRYLWQLMAGAEQGPESPNVGGALVALLAAGLLAEDEPDVAAVRWAVDRQGGRPMRHRQRHTGPPLGPGEMPEPVPVPWRSLWSSPPVSTGASGSIAVAATTPVFDGVSAAVNFLRAEPGSFTVEAEVAGRPAAVAGSFSVPLAWWASDDRGRHYLGHINGWGSGDDHGMGQIRFGPLDPRARALTVAITSLHGRALVHVPLDWGA
jgi:hypothetical protein